MLYWIYVLHASESGPALKILVRVSALNCRRGVGSTATACSSRCWKSSPHTWEVRRLKQNMTSSGCLEPQASGLPRVMAKWPSPPWSGSRMHRKSGAVVHPPAALRLHCWHGVGIQIVRLRKNASHCVGKACRETPRGRRPRAASGSTQPGGPGAVTEAAAAGLLRRLALQDAPEADVSTPAGVPAPGTWDEAPPQAGGSQLRQRFPELRGCGRHRHRGSGKGIPTRRARTGSVFAIEAPWDGG